MKINDARLLFTFRNLSIVRKYWNLRVYISSIFYNINLSQTYEKKKMISCIVLKKFSFYDTFLEDAYVKYTRVTNSYKKRNMYIY